jgi:hypothetical protein
MSNMSRLWKTRHFVLGVLCWAAFPEVNWACDPAWLPVSAPQQLGYFVATIVRHSLASAVGAKTEQAGGSAARYARSDVVLVPWAYGSGCEAVPLGQAEWRAVGTRGFFTGQLRSRSSWQSDEPTFDVYMAWREPLWQDDDPRWNRQRGKTPLMTAEEFFLFYAALPTPETLDRTPDRALSQLKAWARRHRALALREPAQTILGNVQRMADSPSRTP